MTEYALLKNPNKHYYPERRKPVKIILLHVTAGLEDLDLLGVDTSAEGTNRYGATTTRQASWHVCVDSDSIAPALPDEYTAWHCTNYNSSSLGLEISNRDARWDNKPQDWTKKTLLNAAKVCLEWERKFNIPRRLLTKEQVDAGMTGYSFHMFLDPTRRRDPGATYPWAYFVALLETLEKNQPAPTPPPPARPVVDPVRPAITPPSFPLPSGWYFGAKNGPKESVSGYYSHRESLRRWQRQMIARGWSFGSSGADGLWGKETERVVRAFQTEKGLGTDGKLGPKTWRAAWIAPVTRG